jgi:hypothetical protein
MATVEQAIHEHDVVALTQPVDKDEGLTRDADEPKGIGQWPAGTVGAVVHDYGDAKLVEISDDQGVALDFITVPVEHLKLIAEHSS